MEFTSKVDLFYMLNATHEANEDSPDGAWQAMIEDGVSYWNREHGTNYDENDTFHEWLAWREEEDNALTWDELAAKLQKATSGENSHETRFL